jgi:hypothetical protein
METLDDCGIGSVLKEPTRSKNDYSSASLAQLVEQLTLNQWVAGSSPAGSTGTMLLERVK